MINCGIFAENDDKLFQHSVTRVIINSFISMQFRNMLKVAGLIRQEREGSPDKTRGEDNQPFMLRTDIMGDPVVFLWLFDSSICGPVVFPL